MLRFPHKLVEISKKSQSVDAELQKTVRRGVTGIIRDSAGVPLLGIMGGHGN